ncbi:MAG: ArsA-related P-loop ATPase [Bdellovibrionota bacterium]|nr:ArsA-related P-loop ATPase [Bdellovibrionota bacterium]
MSLQPKRLYFFTGKGGVGKTTFAMALTKYLQQNGSNVIYYSFDQDPPLQIINALKVPFLHQTVKESAEIYIERKLNSKIVANWIMKTPFFKSLLNITPSIGHMICLGHLIDRLEKEPDLTLVVDAPASGHTLSLFNSTQNFREMFQRGPLVEDIHRMHSFLKNKNNLKVVVLCLPNIMNIQEALELKDGLQKLELVKPVIILNEVISNINLEDQVHLPEFLGQKLKIEQSLISKFKNDFVSIVPFVNDISYENILKSLIKEMKDIV